VISAVNVGRYTTMSVHDYVGNRLESVNVDYVPHFAHVIITDRSSFNTGDEIIALLLLSFIKRRLAQLDS